MWHLVPPFSKEETLFACQKDDCFAASARLSTTGKYLQMSVQKNLTKKTAE
jgi:hypothetical protein